MRVFGHFLSSVHVRPVAKSTAPSQTRGEEMEERQRKDSWKARETPNQKEWVLNYNQTSGVKSLMELFGL